MEDHVPQVLRIHLAQVHQRGDIGEFAPHGVLLARHHHLPIVSAPLQVFPAHHIPVDGAELVVQRQRVVVVDEDEAFTHGQFLEQFQQGAVPVDGHHYAHVEFLVKVDGVAHVRLRQ